MLCRPSNHQGCGDVERHCPRKPTIATYCDLISRGYFLGLRVVEGLMSGQTAKSLGWVALLVLVTGVNPALPANPAGADDCRSGPNSPAPAGTHWYYRLDWATQRKCWYVRAQSRRTSLATAPAVGVPASAPHSVLVRFDPTPAPEIVPTSPSPSYNAAAPSVRAVAMGRI